MAGPDSDGVGVFDPGNDCRSYGMEPSVIARLGSRRNNASRRSRVIRVGSVALRAYIGVVRINPNVVGTGYPDLSGWRSTGRTVTYLISKR